MRIKPALEVFAVSEKLNLPSERLLSVVGSGVADSWFFGHRSQAMWENSTDIGFKLSLLPRDLPSSQGLAQDLDTYMPTVEDAISAYSVSVELDDGDDDISGLNRLKRGINDTENTI